MFVIANNLTTRDSKVNRAFVSREKKGSDDMTSAVAALQGLATTCAAAGAGALEVNLQQHHDRPEAMEFAVKAVQEVTDLPLCLSTNLPGVLEAGLRACRRPPIVNYMSMEKVRLEEMLPLAARHQAHVVLLATEPGQPNDAQDMLRRASILVGAANEAGITDDRIIVDPGLLHVTADPGPRHLMEVVELLRAFPEVFEPGVRSTCWVDNASAGAPKRLRAVINTGVLAMLAGLGLSSVFLDVLDRHNMQAVRLLRVLRNEAIYSARDLEA